MIFVKTVATSGMVARRPFGSSVLSVAPRILDVRTGHRVAPAARSRMNVPFSLHDPALDRGFLDGAKAAGLIGLKGHRALGGMRASLYNAMPEAGVQALVDFMADFAGCHG